MDRGRSRPYCFRKVSWMRVPRGFSPHKRKTRYPMIQHLRLIGGASVAFLLSACGARLAPTAKATQVEQTECSNEAGQDDLRLLQTAKVLRAEPIYARIH